MRAQALDPRLDRALEELKAMIRQRYPEAEFRIGTSPDDPDIIELVTVVDDDDPNQLLDLVIGRQITLQVDDGLPIFVVTEPTVGRAAAMLEAAQAKKSGGAPAR
jgi:hypothetical protein